MKFIDGSNAHFPTERLADEAALLRVLERARSLSPPGMCELVHDNGFTLTVGIGDLCSAQYAPSDGDPPYLMAVSPDENEDAPETVEFMFDGSLTEIPGMLTIPSETLKGVTLHFFQDWRSKRRRRLGRNLAAPI
jgi:hypothetical protein